MFRIYIVHCNDFNIFSCHLTYYETVHIVNVCRMVQKVGLFCIEIFIYSSFFLYAIMLILLVFVYSGAKADIPIT